MIGLPEGYEIIEEDNGEVARIRYKRPDGTFRWAESIYSIDETREILIGMMKTGVA